MNDESVELLSRRALGVPGVPASIRYWTEPRGTRQAAFIECPTCGLTRELGVTFDTPGSGRRVAANVAAAHGQRHVAGLEAGR